ncbi:MAG: dihydroorotate dehydrogenase (fumarate) [Verrucomicrobia bacterium]|nr:MAG: dihydroorotate dehydrogenase (fumarate) [Verrucomicrobiota bacterium]
MNLSTQYLGLKLKNPLVVGASPFGDNTYMTLELQDAGAGAIIMRSLFEEQVDAEQRALVHHVESTANSNPEGTSYFPRFEEYQLAPDQYLRQLAQLKSSLTIPVIASLNGCRPGGWTSYARRLESAGADAIELNLYQLATDPELSADEVETELLETVRHTLASVRIPVAVKISAFHTAPVHFAKELEATGVAGVVLFNRFYQPDFNIEELEVNPQLKLSDSSELLLRLRWLAILSPHMRCSLAASGGVHQSEDVVKALLAGADVVQVVSALLKHGPKYLTILLAGLRHWMDEHGYTSIDEVRGAMNLRRCPNPAAFERANYQRILQSWRI